MRDIGVGLIGYGLGGRAFHAPFIDATPGMTLRAVVSRDPAKVLADRPGTKVVPDVTTLLAEPGLDLIVVSSPDDLHGTHAIAALQAGKHVLVDKPFATTLAEARAIAAEAGRVGKLVTVFHNRRWDADFLTLRRLLADGTLGRIVHFESHFDRWRPVSAPVWKEARTGGSWLDLGPHLVDQALCLFGKPQAITLDLAVLRDAAPAPDYFHATLTYDHLRVVLHASKLAADHGLRFAVHGMRGSWLKRGIDPQEAASLAGIPPGAPNWGEDANQGVLTAADDPVGQAVPNEPGDYGAFWRALGGAIHGQAANPVPAGEALAVMEVLDAGLRSAEEGRTVLC
jgi:predicted dehydrogenase